MDKQNKVKQTGEVQMGKLVAAVVGTLAVVAIIGVLVWNFSGFGFNTPIEVETVSEISSELITASIMEITELATLSYDYRNVIVFSEQTTVSLFGAQLGLPGTTRSLIAAYSGSMRIGIDTSNVSVNIAGSAIIVTLPAAQILTHAVDMDSIRVLNEESGLFTSIVGIEEFAELVVDEMDVMEAEVLASTMLNDARLGAENAIRRLLEAFPEVAGNYEIVFV